MSDRYNIIRFFQRDKSRVVRRNVSLAEAQEHCRNPETSSETARLYRNRKRTELRGPWFDGYDRA